MFGRAPYGGVRGEGGDTEAGDNGETGEKEGEGNVEEDEEGVLEGVVDP